MHLAKRSTYRNIIREIYHVAEYALLMNVVHEIARFVGQCEARVELTASGLLASRTVWHVAYLMKKLTQV